MVKDAAVNGQKDILAVGRLPEAHIIAQPAFNPAALVIIGAGAFGPEIIPALKAIDIKLPDIITDPLKVFYQFTVSQGVPPFCRDRKYNSIAGLLAGCPFIIKAADDKLRPVNFKCGWKKKLFIDNTILKVK